jgi:hypothetical protein
MENLNEYASDITSGDGTNGILIEIFKRLGIEKGTCVEFGANDGLWNSNTAPFYKKGWQTILIEPGIDEYDKLNKNVEKFKNVFTLNCFVDAYPKDSPEHYEGHYHLDAILNDFNVQHEPHGIKFEKDFDLVSIDVDGNDYHIWSNFEQYKPKCVVIEYNQTIPPNLEYVDPIQKYLGTGASIKSFVMLAKEKGYSLVACTGSNLIFVSDDHISKLGEITTNVLDLFDLSNLTCLVSCQKQDRVYLTKKRPPNYYMTKEKIEKAYLLEFPPSAGETREIRKNSSQTPLHPVQAYYDRVFLSDSGNYCIRIVDDFMIFLKVEPGQTYSSSFSVIDINKIIQQALGRKPIIQSTIERKPK